MKTKQLINEYLSKRKGTLIVYLILCILYYPLQSATFTISMGKLFDKLANIQKNKKFIYQILLIISVLYILVNLALLGKEKIESIIIPEFNNELRIMIFDNIINKMRIKFKDVDIGDFISRISMITLKWDEVIQIAASIIIPQSLTIIVVLSLFTYYGPKYGLITMVYIYCVFILLFLRYKYCVNKLINLRYTLNSRHNDIQDKINNLFDIYLANKENEEKILINKKK